MKNSFKIAFALMISSSAFAKIVHVKDQFYVESKGKKTPIVLLNELIKKKEISTVKLYRKGKTHMVSFAKNDDKEKHYSIDEKGFMYSIEPFSSYKVVKVDDKGFIHFAEVPKGKFTVNEKGFFIK